jgi:hypothetical protein
LEQLRESARKIHDIQQSLKLKLWERSKEVFGK